MTLIINNYTDLIISLSDLDREKSTPMLLAYLNEHESEFRGYVEYVRAHFDNLSFSAKLALSVKIDKAFNVASQFQSELTNLKGGIDRFRRYCY